MEEEAAEDLGDRKNPMPVRNGPEHVPAEPLAELHGPFLSAAEAELSLLTTEREEPFCAAGVAANAGKTCAQVATLQVMDHDLLQIGSPEAVAFRESFWVNLFEGFIMILDALVEGGQMRLSGTVDRAGFAHGVVVRKR